MDNNITKFGAGLGAFYLAAFVAFLVFVSCDVQKDYITEIAGDSITINCPGPVDTVYLDTLYIGQPPEPGDSVWCWKPGKSWTRCQPAPGDD